MPSLWLVWGDYEKEPGWGTSSHPGTLEDRPCDAYLESDVLSLCQMGVLHHGSCQMQADKIEGLGHKRTAFLK